MGKKKILIVDDDIKLLNTLKVKLEENGYQVITAENGFEGLKKVEKETPDLVITDVVMPEKDGAELIFDLQKDFPNIKMIAMTGTGQGAQAYLQSITSHSKVQYAFEKPFEMDELLRAVKEAVG